MDFNRSDTLNQMTAIDFKRKHFNDDNLITNNCHFNVFHFFYDFMESTPIILQTISEMDNEPTRVVVLPPSFHFIYRVILQHLNVERWQNADDWTVCVLANKHICFPSSFYLKFQRTFRE